MDVSGRAYRIDFQSANDSAVVTLPQEVDFAVVPDLREALDRLVATGCASVILDFAAVDYADSSALGLLVWLDRLLEPANGRIVLAGAGRDITRILELSGLIRVAPTIAMSPNVDAAIEGLNLVRRPTEPEWTKEMSIPAKVEELSGARQRIGEIVGDIGFPESALFDIKVALGEALANAIRHGSKGLDRALVRVRVISHTDRVVLEVEDEGPGYDGRHRAGDDIYASGGRGVMFMRALMDRVEFETSPMGGTLVRLTKHRVGARA